MQTVIPNIVQTTFGTVIDSLKTTSGEKRRFESSPCARSKAFTVAAARSFGTWPVAECISFAIWKPSGACTAAVQQLAASLAKCKVKTTTNKCGHWRQPRHAYTGSRANAAAAVQGCSSHSWGLSTFTIQIVWFSYKGPVRRAMIHEILKLVWHR